MNHDNSKFLSMSRFDYVLPPELIAQQPVEPRDAARMLVIERETGTLIDAWFRDLPEFLNPSDVLVTNDSRVIPARLFARRSTGGKVELLFLNEQATDVWLVLARPARKLRIGERLEVMTLDGVGVGETAEILGRGDSGAFTVHVNGARSILDRFGQMPLPPYIAGSLDDPERYQTVYANRSGSAAAPTAGLHFTDELLARCRDKGVETVPITLHVGLDTFQPVKAENALEHQIHSEWYDVSPGAVETLREARESARRVVAVGTTVARTLETIAGDLHAEGGRQGLTRIYITPPHAFELVGAMITNFHLPRTTLLLMVSALAGEDLIRKAYAHAIKERFRFYSFGDATFIV